MLLWIAAFITCTIFIVYAGTRLSKYGDIIAEKSGLGRTWIGVLLMASITSLPELVTGISSVTYAQLPDIAVGNVLGACVLNLLIFAILDAVHRQAPLSSKAHQGNILAAAFSILQLGIVLMGLFLYARNAYMGTIGFYTFLFIAVYLVAMKVIYSYEKRKNIAEFVKDMAEELRYEGVSTKSATLRYFINALIVVIAAIFLPKIGEGIAEASGLSQTFVGTILLAVSTSLPEIVVSVAAVRIGAVDLAIGNLFGSNVFNIFILAIDDILYTKGPLLAFADPNQTISAVTAVMMTAVAIIGLTYRAEKKVFMLGWESATIALLYITNVILHLILS